MTAADLARSAAEDAELTLVLAAWESDPEDAASLLAGLEPTDLTCPAAAEGLRAVQTCLARGERPSRLAVRRHMVGCPDLYGRLADEDAARGGVVTGAEARAAREEVRLSAARLRARRAVRALEAELDAPSPDLVAWRARAGQVLAQIGPGPAAARAGVDMPSVLRELLERYRRGEERAGFVSTGLEYLDRLLRGIGPGELAILAGRPGTGKSALALQIAAHVARAQGAVLFVSLEMSRFELAGRLVRQSCQIGEDEVGVARIASVADRYPRLYIEDEGNQLEGFEALADSFRRAHQDAVLLVVDYLGLLRVRGNPPTLERVSTIARALKELARRLNLPLLALAQLRRPDRGGDKPPEASDLRDSGELEQAANKVLLLYRRGPATPGPRTVEVIVGKNREGPEGKVALHWQPDTLSFHTIGEVRPPEPRQAPDPRNEELFL